MKTHGFAATAHNKPLSPFSFDRRELRANDVAIEILYSGICHTDLHTARNDWGITAYPVVPGHEIIGRVIAVGSEVKARKVGDAVAVGTMVDACMTCDQCRRGEEQMCRTLPTYTFGGHDRVTGELTQGGFAKHLVVREEFALAVPKGLDLTRAAPLLCGGVTVYSPLRTWKVGPGSRVGVVGLGGLGHLAVKFAVGLGAHVTVLSRTKDKEAGALALGADALLVSSDAEAVKRAASSFDVIIDTVPYKHNLSPYVSLLDIEGTLVLVGQLGPVDELNTFPLVAGRRRIVGSPSGGLSETQEMLEFCARKNILPDVEVIRLEQVNEAFVRLDRSDVRYRFVIDMTKFGGAV
ncbi:NAD(P)-dependent alcohol dehydrogenase [Stigmatella aurantiaca]|nr:NAD(P)-dependent alcohol dehydrogenase [Stigmatella aurantiaca]ADO70190.1 NADP-dependent alcohol dehydrogenase [Stigmatella aurantiaca DW4/3-1]